MSNVVPSVVSTIRIMQRLAHEWPDGITVATLVNELSLNRSTCFNIIATLSDAEWVTRRDRYTGWTLGPRIFEISGLKDNARFVDASRELARLADELGQIVFISEKNHAGDYVVIAKADPGRGVRITTEVGDHFPYGAPALMASFEAFTPPATVEQLVRERPLPRFTETSITTFDELSAALAGVRARGFASSVRRYDPSQSGVAAPIFDARGRVAFVLCTLAFSTVLDEENVMSVGIRMRETAEAITRRLGGVAPTRASGAGVHVSA